MRRILGVDIGGVLRERGLVPIGNYADVPPVDGAFADLRKLGSVFDKIYVISKSGLEQQQRKRAWLETQHFSSETQIPLDNVRFCLRKEEKARLCWELAVTDFVDNRAEVLSYLGYVRHRYLFRGDPEEISRFTEVMPYVRCVDSWDELTNCLIGGRRKTGAARI